MLFQYTQYFAASVGMGSNFLYEIASGSAAGPTGVSIEDQVTIGMREGWSRETIIGGYN
jgi:hypothetical protein